MIRSRLPAADIARVGTIGLRIRRLRTLLTALGISIGIAAMVAVVGISSSSRADLLAQIDSLGTSLLRVAPGQTMFGEETTLAESARGMAERIGPVDATAGTSGIDGAAVYRSDFVDPNRTNGITLLAADSSLLEATGATLAQGRFLDAASERYPTVVLGADTAERLGIRSLEGNPRVWVTDADSGGGSDSGSGSGSGGGEWFAVIGILERSPLVPELDGAALIGYPVASSLFETTTSPSTLYVQAAPEAVDAVRAILARSLNPEAPNEVNVARPSDALEARAATDTALRNLLLALGGVALVVGGVGITNVMVISVLERRNEIGVRRALGARRIHIASQFVVEAGLLAALGGLGGVGLGAAVTALYARSQGWLIDVPVSSLAGGAAAALAVGLLAGVSPAIRAARLDPADALRS